MSLQKFIQFQELLSENNLDTGKLTVSESLAIAEDISLSESVPERISEKLNELYGEDSTKLMVDIKEAFKGSFIEESSEDEDDSEDGEGKNDVEESDEELEDEDLEDDDYIEESFEVYIDKVVDAIYVMESDADNDADDDADDDADEDTSEGVKPKKLTGSAKLARDAKSQLMAIVKKDEGIKNLISKTKKKIIQTAKSLGKKNGIKVNKVDFSKIKL